MGYPYREGTKVWGFGNARKRRGSGVEIAGIKRMDGGVVAP